MLHVQLTLLWCKRHQAAEGEILQMKQQNGTLSILKLPQQFLYYYNNVAKPLENFCSLNSILPQQDVNRKIRNGKFESLNHSEENFDQYLV